MRRALASQPENYPLRLDQRTENPRSSCTRTGGKMDKSRIFAETVFKSIRYGRVRVLSRAQAAVPCRVGGYGARLFTTPVRYALCNAATSLHLFATVALAGHTPRSALSWRCRPPPTQSPH